MPGAATADESDSDKEESDEAEKKPAESQSHNSREKECCVAVAERSVLTLFCLAFPRSVLAQRRKAKNPDRYCSRWSESPSSAVRR